MKQADKQWDKIAVNGCTNLSDIVKKQTVKSKYYGSLENTKAEHKCCKTKHSTHSRLKKKNAVNTKSNSSNSGAE